MVQVEVAVEPEGARVVGVELVAVVGAVDTPHHLHVHPAALPGHLLQLEAERLAVVPAVQLEGLLVVEDRVLALRLHLQLGRDEHDDETSDADDEEERDPQRREPRDGVW